MNRFLLALWCLVVPLMALADTGGVPFRALPKQPPIPADNPLSEAKVELGRHLYYDPRISFTGTVTCNSCHDLKQGGDDGQAVSVGALGVAGHRSAPTLWNIGFQTALFWDGRAATLEDAINEHLFDETVMAMPDAATVIGRLQSLSRYREAFSAAYGRDHIRMADVVGALSAYLRTLVTPDSAFDRYLQGDPSAMSESAQGGYALFVDKGCAACHFWTLLAGPVPGLAFKPGEPFFELFPTVRGTAHERVYDLLRDQGLFLLTGNEGDRFMWRVPTLRNVAETAPYFHNGRVENLHDAVRVMSETQFGVSLSEEDVGQIVEFLNALTGVKPSMPLPEPWR